MRYPLVDGQGNFGSVDGDMPAAMRYTEARLQGLADDLMADLEKETVDFVPNYDETTEEPTVLPAPIPNLLVNGSSGIAVGMATNVPPHNLTEVIDGVIYVIDEQQKARRLAGPAGRGLGGGGRARDDPRRAPAAALPHRHRARLPHRRHHRRPVRHRAGLPRGPRLDHRPLAHRRRDLEEGRSSVDRRHRDSVPGQQEAAHRKHRGPGARQGHRGHLGPARRIRPRRHADRDRAQARRGARGHPQQPLQAHAAADDVRHHHAGHRPRPAEGAEPSRVHRGVHRVPPRSRAAAHRVRAAQGRSARPHPRGAAHRPRSPRPGDRDHPRRPRRRPRRATG